jgi:DNA modification methylase
MCGDSTIEDDVLKLMNGEKADMCFTDPPYILDYLKGKKKAGEAVTGFGAKRNRRYLETDTFYHLILLKSGWQTLIRFSRKTFP